MDPQVFRCKVLNTLHVQEVFFRSWIYGHPGIQVQSIEYFARARSIFQKLDIWTPRYLGAKYSILCTCKKYIFKVGYMDPQVFRCKVLNTLHVQEVFFQSWIYGPQVFRCKVLNTLHVQKVFFRGWIYRTPGIQVQSIEYFACARSIFSKLDIWIPRYSGAKY